MEVINDVFSKEVIEVLGNALARFPGDSTGAITRAKENLAKALFQPPQFSMGQAAVPCHPLAKVLKTSPAKIADSLAATLNSGHHRYITKVDAVNGYLNFHCQFVPYATELFDEIRNGSFYGRTLIEKSDRERIVVEFSQPNTHKAIHVGHLRNMVYGEAVCQLLEYVGHEIVRATYPGDLGTHIAKTLWYLQTQKIQRPPAEDKADWLGKMYAKADDYVNSLEGTPQATQVKLEIASVLQELQQSQGPAYQLYLETREWSIAKMREIYDWLGIHFDVWYFESECDAPSRELVLEKFQEGLFVKSEGAIGIDLSSHNLGFVLLLKSNGNGLYLTKDLELIRQKFSDPRVTRSLIIVDSRQKLHFQQLFKTAEAMGYPQAAKSEHLSYETVTTEDGKPFSSRSLNGKPLNELRALMESKVISDYLESYRGEWSDEEIKQTAEAITLGALKYGFLKVDSNGVIKFILEDWLKLDGETGPYLQYVHARCTSLLSKLGKAPEKIQVELQTHVENEIVHFFGRFDRVVLQAAVHYRPSVLTAYLYDLCKLFNRFYTDCNIKSSTGHSRDTRLAIVEVTASVLRKGLSLLGIPAPDKM